MTNDTINTIVDKIAQEQVLLLVKNLELADATLLKLAANAAAFAKSKNFPSPNTPKQYNNAVSQSSKFLTQAKAAAQEAEKANNGLTRAKAKYAESASKAAKETVKVKTEMQQASTQARNLAKISSALSTEYEKQSARLTILQRTQKHYNTIVEMGGKLSKKQQSELKRTTAEINRLDSALKRVDAAAGQFNRNVGNYPRSMGGAVRTIRNLASAAGLLGGAFLAIQVARDASNSIIAFDRSMQNLAGILRTNRADLADLQEEIIAVAGASVNTATDVAKLAESLVTMGKSKEEVKGLLSPVNDLAIGLSAAGADAGEFLVQTMNAFGAGTEEAGIYADQIATIRTSTSLDFQKMRDSFSYLSPISKLLNKDLAHTGAVIGILADNGLKAESAGRLLSTAQQSLAKGGVSLNQGLEMINKAISEGKDELEVLAVASEVFGKQAGKVGAILAANTNEIDINAQAIRENTGALKDLVSEQLKSLGASLSILKSRWEEYVINSNLASGASEFFSKIINFLSDNLENILGTLSKGAIVFAVYKTAVMASSIQTAVFSKRTVAARIVANLMSGSVNGLRKAFVLLNRTMKVSPWGLAAAAITIAVIAYNKFSKKVTRTAKDIKRATTSFLEQKKETQALVKKTNELIQEYEDLQKITNKTEAEQARLNTVIKLLAKNIPGAISQFDEYAKAIGISKESVEEFVKTQEDLLKQGTEARLKEETELLKKQEIAQKNINKLTKEGGEASVEGLGKIIRINNKFIKQTEKVGLYGLIEKERKSLTAAENDALRSFLKKRNEEVQATRDRIAELKGEKTLAQKLKELQLKQEDEEKGNVKIILEYRRAIAAAEKELFEIRKKGENEINEKDAEKAIALEELISEKKKLIKEILGEGKSRKKNLRVIKGSVAFYEKLISTYESERDRLEKSAEGYKSYNEKIKAAKDAIDLLIGAKKKLEDTPDYDGEGLSVEEEINDSILGFDSRTRAKEIEDKKRHNDEKLELDKKYVEKRKDLQRELVSSIQDLTNTLFDAKVQRIDDEIYRNNEYHETLLENESLTDKEREDLEAQRDAKNKDLEKRKKEEKVKQAQFNKALTIAQIPLNIAEGITKIIAGFGGTPFALPLIATTAAIGAVQLATAIATPIPAYKKGKPSSDNYEGTAWLGDGGVSEIVEGSDGSIQITPSIPTLMHVKSSDVVHPNTEAYFNSLSKNQINEQLIRASMVASASAPVNAAKEFNMALDRLLEINNLNSKGIEKAVSRGMRNASINSNVTIKYGVKYRDKYKI